MPSMLSKGVFFYKGKPYDFGKLGENFGQVKKSLPPVLARIAVEHFKESFENEGFTDRSLIKWEKRDPDPDPGRAILMKSGELRDATHASKETFREIVISNDKPYAKRHNEGFRGIEYVRPHHRKTKYGKQQVRGFSRRVEVKQRQFMGYSQVMDDDIEKMIDKKIMQIFD